MFGNNLNNSEQSIHYLHEEYEEEQLPQQFQELKYTTTNKGDVINNNASKFQLKHKTQVAQLKSMQNNLVTPEK